MKAVYAAYLTPKEEGGFRAVVPDVPGCVTSGADLPETLDMIADALHGCLCVLEDEHQAIPAPTAPEALTVPAGAVTTLVSVDTEAYRMATDTRAVRKNVSIPAWMDRLVQKNGVNCSQVLQEALRVRFAHA